jgi:hypothetical protein
MKPGGSMTDAKDFSLRTRRHPAGGARRDRTDDLLLAKQALSQLSYGPSGEQQSEVSNQKGTRVADYWPLITDA